MGVLPLAVFGTGLMLADLDTDPRIVWPLLIASLVGGGLLGLLVAAFAVSRLTKPLRRITAAVERVAAGEPGPPLRVGGEDELARLAESHNRIAGEVQRRNRELTALLEAVDGYVPAAGVETLRAQAEKDACSIYGLIDCDLQLVNPDRIATEERIPGDPRPVRAELRSGGEAIGVLDRPSARDAKLGAGGPGPARPVRQRSRRGLAERGAVRPDRAPERQARRA